MQWMMRRWLVAMTTLLAAGSLPGVVWAADPGEVLAEQKISALAGGFEGIIAGEDRFGSSVAAIGDLDGDGVPDLAVGARLDDDQSADAGAVWILFMNADGTVSAEQKISATEGGFSGTLDPDDRFGSSVASLGDIDGDGVVDLAVGARVDDDGALDAGAVWILFLNPDGTTKGQQKISATAGGFTETLASDDRFGTAVGGIGDFDGNGVPDLAVGARLDDAENIDGGAVYVILLEPDGRVKASQKIPSEADATPLALDVGDFFGSAVTSLGDLDGDGVTDLAVGSYGDADYNTQAGAIWILFLEADGTLKAAQKISSWTGEFGTLLGARDRLGSAAARLGDLDGDGVVDLAVAARGDDDGAKQAGAIYVLFLETDGTVKSKTKISATQGGFTGPLDEDDLFGPVAALGDIDGDGVTDIAVGAPGSDDAAVDAGAVWALELEGAAAVCGNGALDPAETCDDANVLGGDGCSADCRFEHFLMLSGTSEGGVIEVVASGESVTAPGFAGDLPNEIVTRLVTVFDDAGLSHLVSRGDGATLWLTATLTEVLIDDPGLGAIATPRTTVTLPEPGPLASAFALMVGLGVTRRSRRTTRH